MRRQLDRLDTSGPPEDRDIDSEPGKLDTDAVAELLEAARSGAEGASEALGQLLDGWRDYLLLLANREFDSVLCPKAGASDLVQETLLEAQLAFDRFDGRTANSWVHWLRTILQHNVANFARRYQQTEKRDIARELPLHQALQQHSCPSGAHAFDFPADTETPSRIAMAREEAERIDRALKRLPSTYRRVIELRYWEGCSFSEIGQRLNRSVKAARKLWFQSVRRLAENLDGHNDNRRCHTRGRSHNRAVGRV